MQSSGTSVGTGTDAEVRAGIRAFVLGNMAALRHADLDDDENLFDKGFVTSIFAVQLLGHIEATYGVEVPDDRLTLRNFSSIDRMAQLVADLRGAAGG